MCTVGPPLADEIVPQKLNPTEPYPIYLDHNATTPICDEAWHAMCGCRGSWGNAGSTHAFGRDALFMNENARATCAQMLGAEKPEEIIFTSGGTEANNMALLGTLELFLEELGAVNTKKDSDGQQVPSTKSPSSADAAEDGVVTVITTIFEHPAVTKVLQHAKQRWHTRLNVIELSVDINTGVVLAQAFEDALKEHASTLRLITIMHANNELGSIQPIAKLVGLTRTVLGKDHPVLFHTDASQSIGKIPANVKELGVDMLTVCSQKFYGPKGVGALYCRSGVKLANVSYGGGQESGMRPGTQNVLLNVGMAAALKACVVNLQSNAEQYRCHRDTLLRAIEKELEGTNLTLIFNGKIETALPNTLNVAFFNKKFQLYCSGPRLMRDVDHVVAMSAGSACHAHGPVLVSDSLKAVDVDEDRAVGTLRMSTGKLSTEGDMKRAGGLIARTAVAQFME